MDFVVSRFKNQKIETADLIDDLLLVAKKVNKTPTMAEYNSNGKYESSTYIRRFGSWNKTLETVGLKSNNKHYTEEELLNNLLSVWIKLYKQPSRRDMDNKSFSSISSGAYLRFYGTWFNALNACVNYANNHEATEIKDKTDCCNKKRRRDFNLRERYLIMKRDNFKCCKCGRSPATTPGLELHVDHIKAWAKGGETTIDNGQTLCSDCNLGKSDLDL